MTRSQAKNHGALLPATQQDIEVLKKKCQRLVVRRAALSAGVAALPIPGFDIATDVTLLAKLIDEINAEFGLTPEQIERLQPNARVIVYRAIVTVGSVLIGKLVTRELVAQLLKRAGMKILVKYTARIVPVAGQIASAALGYALFRAIGNQHIDACASVTEELIRLRVYGTA